MTLRPTPNPLRLAGLAALACSIALAGCGGSADHVRPPPLELTIVHINDHHSNLDPFSNVEMLVDGEPTRVELGGFARVSQAFQAHGERDDVLRLHAGDASTGTLYYTLFKGAADAALMNSVCFDAMAVGNHEFDDGDAQLARFIEQLHAGNCRTPVLAANIRPQPGTPLAPWTAPGYLQPHTVKTVRGVPVGIIGIATKAATMNSSRPLPSTVFEDEVPATQRSIDQLKRQGVRHIVLLSHLGHAADLAIAAQLSDIDAIIGGHTHTLLGDFGSLGPAFASAGPYPARAVNKDGAPVCIGQAWEFGKAIGEMRLRFDAEGRLLACEGQAALLLGEHFQRRNAGGDWAAVDADTQQRIAARLAANPAVKLLAPEPRAAATLRHYADQVEAMKARQIGSASEALCLVRVPGEAVNRSAGTAGCEAAHTLARGSDVAQLTAEAFLAASLRADLALQNAGGVRAPLAAGPLTMNSAFTVMPFTNVLIELPLSGAQVLAVLEDAVEHHLQVAPGSDGSHPYAAGLRWHLDLRQPRGQRFSQVQVRERVSGRWSAIDPARTYIVVTHDFLATGRDGYTTLGAVYASGNYVNTYLLYTQTLVDHIQARGSVGRPSPGDYSHQSVITRAGVQLP